MAHSSRESDFTDDDTDVSGTKTGDFSEDLGNTSIADSLIEDSDEDKSWRKSKVTNYSKRNDSDVVSDSGDETVDLNNITDNDRRKTEIIESKSKKKSLDVDESNLSISISSLNEQSTRNDETRHGSARISKNNRSNLESSDEDDEVNFTKPRLKKNIIELGTSSSEAEDDSPSTDNEEIDGISTRLNRSVISGEFDFATAGKIVNSTTLDGGLHPGTPLCNYSSKRSLNRSMETPRIIKQSRESNTPGNIPVLPSTSQSLELVDFSDEDVIEVSSDEDKAPKNARQTDNKTFKQTTLDSHYGAGVKQEILSPNVQVYSAEYDEQSSKVRQIESDVHKAANVLRTVNLEHLPDKGLSIKNRHAALEKQLLDEVKKLSKMVVTKENLAPPSNKPPNALKPLNVEAKTKLLSWKEIEAKAVQVQPRTFGRQALSTYNAQKAVTMDRLQQLHGSLKSCPKDTDFADDPKGLKVELMPHQKHALSWMMWREKQKPSGGILADDMGLGKTLTMIALLMKTKDESNDSDEENDSRQSSTKCDGGTLIVCPASLINQWSTELERRTKRGLISYEMYHGPKRETNPKRLAQHDMVITTYAIVNNECDKMGTVFRVRWNRIIIDEGHQIRNHKSATSVAVCKLPAKSRWALTGTPVHNKELDMYALLKYLRCTPFDDLQVWKRWVGDKSTGGQERLHTVISSLMLRRTKAELIEKGILTTLPERKWELIPVQLHKTELDVYNRILIFSRTLFAQFLHQRAEKNQDARDVELATTGQANDAPNQEYFKMRQKLLRLNKVKDIKQHEILVLLLRLRQICCHPSLITGMLHEDMPEIGDDDDDDEDGHAQEFDLLSQLNNLALTDDEYNPNLSGVANGISGEALGLKEAARGLLNPSHPVFSKERLSSKIKVMLNVLKEKVLTAGDKAIIVSQWSSFLKLIAFHLRNEGVCYDQLDGSVPVVKRMDIVDCFNDPNHKMKVLLLSLTAGGVGLNLIGGNHLFLLDLHWNPQLENQAQDRIYRVGQMKPVFVYKFMATDTIEKRILDLQEKKLGIANSMLTGTKQVIASKLSLQDLKMLFEM